MAIVFGTDFSTPARRAGVVAAHLARRRGTPLLVVHVRPPLSSRAALRSGLRKVAEIERDLEMEAQRLRTIAPQVEASVRVGFADEELLAAATSPDHWIVLGALGERSPSRWLIGSVAERTVQAAQVPVLVVREPRPLLAWLHRSRPLRIVLGADGSLASRAAAHWLRKWCTFGRCAVTVVHVLEEQPGRWWTFDVQGADARLSSIPTIAELLGADFTRRLRGSSLHFQTRASHGSVAEELVQAAAETRSSLLVVGSHARAGMRPWFRESVSRLLLHSASTNIACVPAAPAQVPELVEPRFRSVLVTTDLSPLGNQAIPFAYAIAEPASTVCLLHVIPQRGSAREPGEARRLRTTLKDWVPPLAEPKGIRTRVEVLAGDDVAETIAAAAVRLRADVICLTTHGEGGYRRILAGSVAKRLARATSIPLLLLRPRASDR